MLTIYLSSFAAVIICLTILHLMFPDDFQRSECTTFSVLAFIPLINTAVAGILILITISLITLCAIIAILNRIDNTKRRKA